MRVRRAGHTSRASVRDDVSEDTFVLLQMSFKFALFRSVQDGSGKVRRVIQIGTRKSQVTHHSAPLKSRLNCLFTHLNVIGRS